MSVQKANPNSSNFDNLNPYHPNDPSAFHYPPITDAEASNKYRPLPTFPYTNIHTMANLPAPSSASGSIAYVIDAPEEQRQQYSNGYGWVILQQ